MPWTNRRTRQKARLSHSSSSGDGVHRLRNNAELYSGGDLWDSRVARESRQRRAYRIVLGQEGERASPPRKSAHAPGYAGVHGGDALAFRVFCGCVVRCVENVQAMNDCHRSLENQLALAGVDSKPATLSL